MQWQVFDAQEGLRDRQADRQNALLCALLYNLNRGTAPAKEMEDYLVAGDPRATAEQSPDELEHNLHLFFAPRISNEQ